MSIIRSYFISKVSLHIAYEDDDLSKRVVDAMDEYFFMRRDGSITESNNITLKLKNNNVPFNVPETAQELSSSPSLRVLKDGDFCYLISGDSTFQLEHAKKIGIGYIDSTF